jgi:hypothetical protein
MTNKLRSRMTRSPLVASAVLFGSLVPAPVLEEDWLVLEELAPPAEVATLYLHLESTESGSTLRAELGSRELSCSLPPFPTATQQAFQESAARGDSQDGYQDVERSLREYGELFYGPIRELVQQSSEIEIVLGDEALVPFPYEDLYFDGKPLFLQKPVAYSFEEIGPGRVDLARLTDALLISDGTADPERAVATIQEHLDNCAYLDISEIEPADLREATTIDLLLVSAHGHVSADGPDHISFGLPKLVAEDLGQMRPELVYFDSCSLGASLDFMRVFRGSGVPYYVAPWFSNEAGNSSTKTMRLFFAALARHQDPVHALFLTRRKLHEHFSKSDSPYAILFRASPFRVYRLASATG